MKGFSISLVLALFLSLFASATRHSSVFVHQPQIRNERLGRGESCGRLLLAEKNDNDPSGGVGAVLSALQLPSPEAVKANIVEGNVGKRGETYVIAQFSMLICIAVGTVPFVGDLLTPILGPAFIIAGLILVYKSAAELKDNLSPWPVPTDPKAGRGSLINEGIYSYIRHPMYSGLLLGMAGLGIFTDSTTRLLLTFALYLVLDAKSDFEEASLVETYGSEYVEYKAQVKNKFFPLDVRSIFTSNRTS